MTGDEFEDLLMFGYDTPILEGGLVDHENKILERVHPKFNTNVYGVVKTNDALIRIREDKKLNLGLIFRYPLDKLTFKGVDLKKYSYDFLKDFHKEDLKQGSLKVINNNIYIDYFIHYGNENLTGVKLKKEEKIIDFDINQLDKCNFLNISNIKGGDYYDTIKE